MNLARKLMRPLASRKIRIAVATVITAYATEFGLNVGEHTVLAVISVGIALILGIAIEDNGKRK